jgi:hypothetical protein
MELIEAERAKDPEYDKKKLEQRLSNNPKAMIKYKLDNIM